MGRFEKAVERILKSVKKRKAMARQMRGKNLSVGCRIFHISEPRLIYRLVRLRGQEALVEDRGIFNCILCDPNPRELKTFPVSELVNSDDFDRATSNSGDGTLWRPCPTHAHS